MDKGISSAIRIRSAAFCMTFNLANINAARQAELNTPERVGKASEIRSSSRSNLSHASGMI